MIFGEALGLRLRAKQSKGAQVPPIPPHSQTSKPQDGVQTHYTLPESTLLERDL